SRDDDEFFPRDGGGLACGRPDLLATLPRGAVMSTPIKPPDGTGGATGPEAPESASVADAEAFEATAKAAAGGTDEVGGATSTSGAAGPEAIAADLQAGRIDLEEAVTRLVDRAVQSGMASGLSE